MISFTPNLGIGWSRLLSQSGLLADIEAGGSLFDHFNLF